ncbi:MAG: hypothetical protein R6X18_08340 [Chloroflexota bacterium]
MQHGLHGRPQIDEDTDEATGPREFDRPLERSRRIDCPFLLIERHSAQGEGFNLRVDVEGAFGKRLQRIGSGSSPCPLALGRPRRRARGLVSVRV